ncbi:MAG: flavin-nucleotide-binding protein [Bacteroidetes bacterium 4572_112]|nr:MAG: flavin-nucleotide-binding protein [Bacteroidetes bacterium 4572_112]
MLTEEIISFFNSVSIMALGTADSKGTPNVSAIASKKIIDANTILTIDTFHNKTIENILENDKVSLAMWRDSEGYQIKGKAKYHTEGDFFEKAKEWILELKPKKIVKGVLEISITDIYYLTPNYELAGKSI